MDENSHEILDQNIPEIQIENQEDLPLINIVLNPDDLQSAGPLATNVPLFIRKLWKIVNDESNEAVISWNANGDGFIIHDQLQFISHTLPRYFKHNQLSSFVRQLNLYDFHKIQHIEKDEFQFSHPFFLRDVPQLLSLIKRKSQTSRQKTTPNTTNTAENQQQSPEVQQLMTTLQDIKTKSDAITSEMSKLRQENAALWGEMSSLRVKYSKQTKIINKLIHFLIAYVQKHHNSRKTGRTVSTSNSNKYLKTGPKIMELDYRYKNNPHEFWSDFDNQQEIPGYMEQEAYTVVEPVETNSENGNRPQGMAHSPTVQVSSTIEEILPTRNAFNQVAGGSPAVDQPLPPQLDFAPSHPSSSKASNSALQRAAKSKKKVGYIIDNPRVELNTIKQLIKNLTPEDMTKFYKLVNENYKNQEDDLNIESEKELSSLGQMSPSNSSQEFDGQISDDDIGPLSSIIDKKGTVDASMSSASVLDDIIQQQNNTMTASELPHSFVQEPTLSTENIDENILNIANDLLNTDDLLTDVSVDQYFNID